MREKVKGMDIFSVRDLRNRSSDMIRAIEAGRLSVITKWGRPSALAMPFDRRLIDLGVDKDLALVLFEQGVLTLAKAAKIADMTIDRFMDVLGETGLAAVDYSPEELDEELQVEL